LWKKSYDELDLQRVSEKQSQCPHGQPWPRAGMAASAAGGTHRAKQSQFAPDRPEETPAAGAASAAAAGDERAKQSQFCRGDVKGKDLVDKAL
jgi:hypothetical protein